jgi:hypothetical protein
MTLAARRDIRLTLGPPSPSGYSKKNISVRRFDRARSWGSAVREGRRRARCVRHKAGADSSYVPEARHLRHRLSEAKASRRSAIRTGLNWSRYSETRQRRWQLAWIPDREPTRRQTIESARRKKQEFTCASSASDPEPRRLSKERRSRDRSKLGGYGRVANRF